MNVIQHATRDDLPKATELHRQLQMIRTVATCVIKTEKGISAAKRRELIAALDREFQDLGL